MEHTHTALRFNSKHWNIYIHVFHIQKLDNSVFQKDKKQQMLELKMTFFGSTDIFLDTIH